MPHTSKLQALTIPKCSILDYLFPDGQEPSDEPQWIDAKDECKFLSAKSAIQIAKRFGQGLQKHGIVARDVCLVFTPNHIYVPPAYLGVVGVGAIFSGANPTFNAKELAFQISTLQPKVVLVHPSLLHVAQKAIFLAGVRDSRLYLFSDSEHQRIGAVDDWRCLLGESHSADNWHWARISPEESQKQIAAINFSSGTTGFPKGVCVSHYNVIANVEQIRSLYDFSTSEKWAGFLPLYHAYGQCYSILMSVRLRIPILIIGKFDFEEYLQIIQKHKIPRLQTVPPILAMLQKRPETAKYDLRSVKEILCGAAPLAKELQTTVSEKYNARITQGWGMTETTCAATGVPWYESPRTGSVGMLMPNTEVMLLDDSGQEVDIDEEGEVFIRGPQIALGYWQNPSATEDTFRFQLGWLRTGDVATIAADGFVRIVDRKKELIKVNASQVSPAELEAVLLEHPDIVDAGVVGITLQSGEWPRAYVKIEERAVEELTEESLQKWFAGKVAKHKRLVGGLVFVPNVPRLPSGKIQRKTLKEWARRDARALDGCRALL